MNYTVNYTVYGRINVPAESKEEVKKLLYDNQLDINVLRSIITTGQFIILDIFEQEAYDGEPSTKPQKLFWE